ncbi:YeeE/YedE family protein [Fulvivirga lutimaris]|nr:YeeE/YedE family protein [Fulvivirga lutimaris]
MGLLLWLGRSFGLSSNFRTICAIGGGAKYSDFFKFNWRDQIWNLVFLTGSIAGGFITNQWLKVDHTIDISESTKADLTAIGVQNPGAEMIPTEMFSAEALFTWQGFIMIILGGFLVGFGTRYAGGCTSGHAISGLSNLQIPSLIAVIGFFIGGLITTHFIIPFLF